MFFRALLPPLPKFEQEKLLSPHTLTSVDELSEGVQMIKLNRHETKFKEHRFKLHVLRRQITWKSKRKPSNLTTIDVDSIVDTRTDPTLKVSMLFASSSALASCLTQDIGSRFLSIHYVANDSTNKTLQLYCPTEKIRDTWILILQELRAQVSQLDGKDYIKFLHATWIHRAWVKVDVDERGKATLDEVAKSLKLFNVSKSNKDMLQLTQSFDEGKKGYFVFEDFSRLCKFLKSRNEVNKIFYKLTPNHSQQITFFQFLDFVQNIQKEKISENEIKTLFHRYSVIKNERYMDIKSFLIYLLSPHNSAIKNESMPMDQPLEHYFILSSHNTYLLGNQFKSESSVEGYIRALQLGCRCVELDCWDGQNEPVVYHGHTLTTKIFFRDVVHAIKRYAFQASCFPVILSLEMHCNLQNQKKIAFYLKSILKDELLTTYTGNVNPTDLKYKVLVKAKYMEDDVHCSLTNMEEEDSKSAVAPELIQVVFLRAKKFCNFDTSGANICCSFSESNAIRNFKQNLVAFQRYHRLRLSRIYPAFSRVTSTNFDPFLHWAAGAQCVALNLQTYDKWMDLNMALFSSNGNTGYVLKPQIILDPDLKKDKSWKVNISIISGQQLPKPCGKEKGQVIDPYCCLEVYSIEDSIHRTLSDGALKKSLFSFRKSPQSGNLSPVNSDSTSHVFRTSTIQRNGWNPMWNESFSFSVNHPQFCILRFAVYDNESESLIGSWCAMLHCMKEGYRHLYLRNWKGRVSQEATLFVHVNFIK